MSKKRKVLLGVGAVFILNIAFIVEDFTGSFRYWNLLYGLLILVVLAALLTGCFRWNLIGKKNTETRAESFGVMNKKQLVCMLCALAAVTIVTAVRCWQTKVHIHPLKDPFIIGTIIVIAPVSIIFGRLFRDKAREESKDDLKE